MVKKQNDIHAEQKIMDAALSVFSENGYDGTTMQMIADKAQVNKALLHYYFRSKDKLYCIVFEKVFIASLELINVSLDSATTTEEMVRRFIDGYFEVLQKQRDLVFFVMRALITDGEKFSELFKQAFAQIRQRKTLRILILLEQACRNKQIAAVDPFMLVQTIIGTAIHFYMAKPLISEILDIPGKKVSSRKFLQQRQDSLFQIVWYGLKPREA